MATWTRFDNYVLQQAGGKSNATQWDNAGLTFRLMFITSTRTPVTATDQFIGNTINANECATGTSYIAKGPAVPATRTTTLSSGVVHLAAGAASVTIAQDAGNGSFSARYVVLYQDTGTATTSPVVAWLDLGANQTINTSSLQLNFDTGNDILTVT